MRGSGDAKSSGFGFGLEEGLSLLGAVMSLSGKERRGRMGVRPFLWSVVAPESCDCGGRRLISGGVSGGQPFVLKGSIV